MEEQNIDEKVVTEEVREEPPKPPEEVILDKKSVRKEKKEKKKNDKEKEELTKANLELKEKVLRITAEMQNMRRRYDLDLANAYKYDGFDLVEKILPILDNFDRALKIKSDGNEKFLEGFKMIYDNLVAILNAKGIVELDCLGKVFDPNIMNAVVMEANSEVEENTVLEVLQKGYLYNDKLLRPAMVKVSEKDN